MSLSWIRFPRSRSHLRLYLGDTELQLARYEKGELQVIKKLALEKTDVSYVIERLKYEFDTDDRMQGCAQIHCALGIAWCRYLLLPWDERLVDKTLAEAMSRALFERRYGQIAEEYCLRLSKPIYGRPQVATFVPLALLNGLRHSCLAHGGSLGRIEPLLAVIWNRFLPLLLVKRSTLCIVESMRMLEVDNDHGTPSSIKVKPFKDANDIIGTTRQLSSIDLFAPDIDIPCHPLLTRLELGDSEICAVPEGAAYSYVLCSGAP